MAPGLGQTLCLPPPFAEGIEVYYRSTGRYLLSPLRIKIVAAESTVAALVNRVDDCVADVQQKIVAHSAINGAWRCLLAMYKGFFSTAVAKGAKKWRGGYLRRL